MTAPAPVIRAVSHLPRDFGVLLAASQSEGFEALGRLVSEWDCAENRFADDGEILLVASDPGGTLGVCGLNADPYADGARRPGRVRRLYVLPQARRRGIGAALVAAIEAHAAETFSLLQLRTHDRAAGAFYVAQGFLPVVGEAHVTHRKRLHQEC